MDDEEPGLGMEEEVLSEDEPEHGYDITPADEDGTVPGDEPDTRKPVQTAFLVFVREDGKAVATSEIEETLAQILPKRKADLVDFQRAAHEILDDVAVAAITQNLLQAQMQMGRQIQEQQQAQAVAAQLAQGGGPRGRR